MQSASVRPAPGGYFGLSCFGDHCQIFPLPYVLVSTTRVYVSKAYSRPAINPTLIYLLLLPGPLLLTPTPVPAATLPNP